MRQLTYLAVFICLPTTLPNLFHEEAVLNSSLHRSISLKSTENVRPPRVQLGHTILCQDRPKNWLLNIDKRRILRDF